MNFNKIILFLDKFQRRYRPTAFTYAVIKRYGDDQAGYQSALLTYYAFLSLFPLLLVLTTLTQVINRSHPALQAKILHATASYFPVLGDQLSSHVHGLHKSGLALIIGILIVFYGTRGVAAAFRYGVNKIWDVPKTDQLGFPKAAINNLVVVAVGGFGFIAAAITAALAGAAGHGLLFRVVSAIINIAVLFWVFTFLLQLSLPSRISRRDTRAGAAAAAIGLVILQIVGGYVLAHVLKNLDALYSYFAISLGLLFWLFLQAQMVYYAVEISVVNSRKLWPRSLSGHHLTDADRRSQAEIADNHSV